MAIAEGRLADALDFARTGVERGIELNDMFLQLWGIEYVASVHVEQGQYETAALLVGAGEAGRDRMGGGWAPRTIGLDDAQLVLNRTLGEETAQAMIQPGRSMEIQEAVELALGHSTETSDR